MSNYMKIDPTMKILANSENFRNNIIRLRLEHHYSKSELVRKMNLIGSTIHRNTYASIENDHKNIKVTDLVALQQIYQVDFAEFFCNVPPYEVNAENLPIE
ncbi:MULTISPECIES: helix-turn-helix transcriptional regulator [Clostridia]|jgi:transcriptional regulator with XRE-family HTH domain|uniref:helix-turn-helix transcriptional regulator n=1 Tax=Clostridia TaxID=186801 RepID=UPI0015FA3888|nr:MULTISPECIES: helix-turn-helix transcriptional regulator [Clostridia]